MRTKNNHVKVDQTAREGSDAFAAYLRDVRRHPLLSPAEEHELAERYVRTRDPAIARRLATSHLRLVLRIALEYRTSHQHLADLVQEGNFGLLIAIRKYDPARGVKLASYAGWWIHAFILRFILNNRCLVKIGTTQAQRKLFYNLQKEKGRLEQQGFAAEPTLLAARLSVRERDVVEMEQRLSGAELSLDTPLINEEGDAGPSRRDLLEAPPESRPDLIAEQRESIDRVRRALARLDGELTPRERLLLHARWQSDEPMVLQELGRRMGVSRERVRQIEQRVLRRVRGALDGDARPARGLRLAGASG
jgi:RNA polymerase sigma-32 factor